MASGQHRRRQLLQFRQKRRGAEHEHTAVPVVVAGIQIALGGCCVGLFDEAIHRADSGSGSLQRRAGLDVAVAGFRPSRGDAKGNQPPCCGVGRRLPHRCAEAFDIGDDVICRQDQQDRISAFTLGVQRRHRDRRRGVAPDRLQDDRPRLDADRAQLLGNHESMLLIAHHQRRDDFAQTGDSQDGVLQQGVLVRQRQKLLGIGFTRQRPQPGTAAAGQDDGNNQALSPRPMA